MLSTRFYQLAVSVAVDVWSRSLLNRLQCTLGFSTSKVARLQFLQNSSGGSDLTWEEKGQNAAVFALQGRRPHMEDRFVLFENIEQTGISLFAVYDGHGGELAADYAKDKLSESLRSKIVEVKRLSDKGIDIETIEADNVSKPSSSLERKASERLTNDPESVRKPVERKESVKGRIATDEVKSGKVTDPLILSKLRSRQGVTRDVQPGAGVVPKLRTPRNPADYVKPGGRIDFGRLISDEVLAADEKLLEVAKKAFDVAGSTALMAVLEGSKLVVANVGDSRGVMCDYKGNAIPLSFDHKPQQTKERQRITQAGGFVSFNGVWRVAGILATSRALGDYPLKDKRYVVAEPDILTFDLLDHRPQFIILASDGLWDAFSNEESVAFIKERLTESDFGARSITMQAYRKGSLDNISVIIVSFKNYEWPKK